MEKHEGQLEADRPKDLRTPIVIGHMDKLSEELYKLTTIIEQLRERLSPIMQKVNFNAFEEEIEDNEIKSLIVERIEAEVRRVKYAQSELNHLIQHTDL